MTNNIDLPPIYDAIANPNTGEITDAFFAWLASTMETLKSNAYLIQKQTNTAQMQSNATYICDNDSKAKLILPLYSKVNNEIQVISLQDSGFTLYQNNAQYIIINGNITTTGKNGYIHTNDTGALGTNVTLKCVQDNLVWVATSIVGTINIV